MCKKLSEKVKAVIYLILFVIAIVGISIFLNYRSNIPKQQNVTNIVDNEENIIIEVNENNFENEVIKSNKKVLIDFYANWCTPCKVIKPKIREVAKENQELKVVEVNVDKCENLATKYGVYSIPTLVVIENGKEINRVIGAVEKGKILEICGMK